MTDKPNIPPRRPGEGSRDYRKRISGGSYKNKPNPKNPYEGMTDEQQREAAAKNQEKLNKKREEERLDQDPERNKQLEDMRQGDFLQDPEQSNAFTNRDILKILQQAASIRPYQQVGGSLFKALTIQQLGGYR